MEENFKEEQIEESLEEQTEEQIERQILTKREIRREERRRKREENSFFQKLLTLVNLLYLASFVFVVLTYLYPKELIEYFILVFTNKYVLAVYPVLGGFVLLANIFLSKGRKPLRIIIRLIVSVVLAGIIIFIAAMMIYNIDIFYKLLEIGI
ncbi:MAG: hypothetical protein GXY89_04845 [Tissierellia bacterium]|nr:hypothetical protein [Tissierellia bacterium]